MPAVKRMRKESCSVRKTRSSVCDDAVFQLEVQSPSGQNMTMHPKQALSRFPCRSLCEEACSVFFHTYAGNETISNASACRVGSMTSGGTACGSLQ